MPKSYPKISDCMNLHNEPQKHIGISIPSGTVALRLLHGMKVDPEEHIGAIGAIVWCVK